MINIEDSTIIICSIVRDAARGLRRNLPVIQKLVRRFKDYKIVIFENDSTDDTKDLLSKWMNNDRSRIIAIMDNRGMEVPIPSTASVRCNPFFSRKRISKMVSLRNQYMEYIEKQGWYADYLMIVDLDVALLNIDNILNSFDANVQWDAVTAFGYSLSPQLKRRYHDTYALTEYGDENNPQTEDKIRMLSGKYGKLKPSDKWVHVYSAFGGLAIYRFDAIKGIRYQLIENQDDRVEVRCEHFSIYKQMADKGYDKVYINPAMVLKYQDLTWKIIFNSIKRKLNL